MRVNYAFAGLVVSHRDQAAAWYERLFGRPPDFLPNDTEAVWQLADTASMYVLADPQRAGRGVVAFVVDDLDASLAELASRGIDGRVVEVIPGSGRRAETTDPDGNVISMVEIKAAS
jgi:predicted enzyme related to lactoylglutathione lyase